MRSSALVLSVLLQRDSCLLVRPGVVENRVIKTVSDQNKFCSSFNLTSSQRSLKSLTANTLTRKFALCEYKLHSPIYQSRYRQSALANRAQQQDWLQACVKQQPHDALAHNSHATPRPISSLFSWLSFYVSPHPGNSFYSRSRIFWFVSQ
jgi:hypothetical protein